MWTKEGIESIGVKTEACLLERQLLVVVSVRDDWLPPDQCRPPRLAHLCLLDGDFFKSLN